jgi:hypothetical protein
MDRSSRRRICKIEQVLSAVKKQREEKRKELLENHLIQCRFHATAVAAIVLSGEPKIDEPLIRAWTHALQSYGIPWPQKGPRINDQLRAAQQLFPEIFGDAEVSARFTEIFGKAPGWLLKFTCMFIDASFLEFNLPHKPVRLEWGSAGYKEWRGWPLLPLGRITDGDPVSDEDVRQWPFPLGMMKPDSGSGAEDNPSRENQDDKDEPSREADFVEDINLVLDLAENPDKEQELSRYEKHRLRDFFERFPRLRSSDD